MIVNGIAQALGADVAGLNWGLDPDTTEGINVFEEQLPPEPDVAVAVYSTGGTEPDSKLPFDPFSIQLIVRGDDNPQTAINLWWAIYDYLHGKRNVTLPDTTYLIYCLVTQAGPVRIGPDVSGRYQFSMNLRGEVHRGSTHRPA